MFNKSLMETFKKLIFLLSPKERKHAYLLLILITIMAILDMIGVASILPFMTVLTNPGLIETNSILKILFQASSVLGVSNNDQFLFALGMLVFILLILSLSFKAFTTYILIRFVQMREYSIGKRLIEGYLYQPYTWYLHQNSADLGKNILSEIQQLIASGMRPMMDLITKGMIAFVLIILLIFADPKLAFTLGFVIGGAYIFIYYFVKKYLNRIGKERLHNNQLRFTSVSEAFGAIKEVKVGGLEQTYIKNFADSSKIFAQTQASSIVIGQLPRFILEAIAFGGILLIILFVMSKTGNFNNALPIISLYVFTGYRLMPALQQIYVAFTRLSFIGISLDKLHNDIKNLKIVKNDNKDQKIISFNKSIILKNIHYNYPNSSRTALKNINIKIDAKTIVGLIGVTGSGKTTIVDIILGLLETQKGSLEVDGNIINEYNLRSWQSSIGYVPQNIFLADDSMAANIAFGIVKENINQDAIEKASKIANLHDFVVDELPEKYQTKIGERGVRLSGGQRQRIGIARALYHNPKILILDEATSALDNQTEKAVMDAINNLKKNITIILIAHRLNTVKRCDKVFLLEKGLIKKEGTFHELTNFNENFFVNVNN